MKKMWTVVVTAVLLVMTWWGLAPAQTGWLNPEGNPGVGVEWSFASMKDHVGFSYKETYPFPTGALFLSARAKMGPDFQFIAELPFFLSKYEITNLLGTRSDSKIGLANPYAGIEYGKPGTSPIAAFGLRFPIISKSNAPAASWGVLHESHRFMAFAYKVIQLSANAGYRYVTPEGSGFRFTAGGQLGIPDEGDA